MLKGALHIHSVYSDGEFTLGELREIYLSAGCAFACLTDHAESLDSRKLQDYRRECESLSDNRFRFVAGLEYKCERNLHILGYGVTSLLTTRDPQEVIRHITELGGVSVIAHPKDSLFTWIESFAVLPHGIEAWNTKYDGRYAPRPSTYRLISRLQGRDQKILAFYGQDLHWKKQFRGLVTVVKGPAQLSEEILAALLRGDFCGAKGELELASNGRLTESLLARFEIVQGISRRLKGLAWRAKHAADRLDLRVPRPLETQLRRFF